MRTKLAILLLFAALSFTLSAQSVATGERLKRIKGIKTEVADNGYLYIGFIHSASEPCRLSTAICRTTFASRGDIKSIFFTREKSENCSPWLKQLISNGEQVVVEASEVFSRFGIDYAPFGVIIDHKRKVVWFGNPQILSIDRLEKIINKHLQTKQSDKDNDTDSDKTDDEPVRN